MHRIITGYHIDDQGDWVAELDCYHGQHLRHKPPLINRPWVLDEQERKLRLGKCLDCLRCDRLEMPDGLSVSGKTTEYNETMVPAGMLDADTIRPDLWGQIHVVSGQLTYRINCGENRRMTIKSGETAVIVPGLPHSIAARGKVRFYIAFHTPQAAR